MPLIGQIPLIGLFVLPLHNGNRHLSILCVHRLTWNVLKVNHVMIGIRKANSKSEEHAFYWRQVNVCLYGSFSLIQKWTVCFFVCLFVVLFFLSLESERVIDIWLSNEGAHFVVDHCTMAFVPFFFSRFILFYPRVFDRYYRFKCGMNETKYLEKQKRQQLSISM